MREPFDARWVPWMGRDYQEPDLVLGSSMLRWVLTWDWVHRRVESVHFLATSRVRRRASLDFTLPSGRTRFPAVPTLVPLALVRKGPAVDLDVRDESACAVPVLTREENSWVAWSSLLALAEAVPGKSAMPHDDLDAVYKALRTLARADEPEATRELNTLINRGRDVWPLGDVMGQVFEKFATDLSRSYLLLVPIEQNPGARRILKYAYDMSLVESLPSSWRQRTAWALGWSPANFVSDISGAATAGSYHLDFHAPEGLECVTVNVHVQTRLNMPVARSAGSSAVMHIELANCPADALATARVGLRVPTRGALRLAMLVVLITAVGLWLAAAFPTAIARMQEDSETAAVILLAFLGFSSVYVSRPEEHSLVGRLSAGVRGGTALAALAAFGAAASLAVTPRDAMLQGLWFGFAGAATLAVALVGTAYRGGMRRPRIPAGPWRPNG